MRVALDRGANMHIPSRPTLHEVHTALELAILGNQMEAFQLLLEKGVSLYGPKSHHKSNGFLLAVQNDRREFLKIDLDLGRAPRCSRTRYYERHPLIQAVRFGHSEILRMLLEHGILFDLDCELDRHLSREVTERASRRRYSGVEIILDEHRTRKAIEMASAEIPETPEQMLESIRDLFTKEVLEELTSRKSSESEDSMADEGQMDTDRGLEMKTPKLRRNEFAKSQAKVRWRERNAEDVESGS